MRAAKILYDRIDVETFSRSPPVVIVMTAPSIKHSCQYIPSSCFSYTSGVWDMGDTARDVKNIGMRSCAKWPASDQSAPKTPENKVGNRGKNTTAPKIPTTMNAENALTRSI